MGVYTSKLDPYRHLFGVERECNIAKIAGVTRQLVSLYRQKHNLPKHEEHLKHITPKMYLPDECIALLGKESDRELARRYNCSNSTIKKRRVDLGIKKFSTRKITDFARENLFKMSVRGLAKHEGVFWTTVSRWRKLAKDGLL